MTIRRPHRLALAAALLAACCFGCGQGETAAPGAPTSSSVVPSPSASPSASQSKMWTADGPSFGVDRARWPTTVQAAGPALTRLPKTFAGKAVKTHSSPAEADEDEETGATAGADYGDQVSLDIFEAYTTTDTESGDPQRLSAQDLMAASFGLVLGCAKGTYRGTAPSGEDGLGPAVPEKPSADPVWFSCAVDVAEGDDDFVGHAVGWTSGETAWQVLGPDEATVRSFVTVVHDATS